MNPTYRRLCVLGAFLVVLVTSAVHAQESAAPTADLKQRYDALVEQGVAAFEAGQPSEARRAFERAHALIPSARTLRVLGMTAMALDEYARAKHELEASLVDRRSPLTPAQRKEVGALLDWMRSSLATVRIESKPVAGRITIDGRPVETPDVLLELGEHHLNVVAEGFEPHARTFQLSSAQPLVLRVELSARRQVEASPPRAASAQVAKQPASVPIAPLPSPESAPSPPVASRPLWPWLVAGAGVIGLASGSVLLVSGLDDVSTVEDARVGVRLAELEPAHDRAPWLMGAGIGLGVAGVACLGVALIALVAPGDERTELTSEAPGKFLLRRRF